jgi:hypothetical protein
MIERKLYPSSTVGTVPLTEKQYSDVWDAGYEAASWYSFTYHRPSYGGEDLFLQYTDKFNDARIPKNMNESTPQFFEYIGMFSDAVAAFEKSKYGDKCSTCVHYRDAHSDGCTVCNNGDEYLNF